MTNTERDRVAFEAAKLIDSGAAADEREAIEVAARLLRIDEPGHTPTVGAVRKHLQGMAMQSLGLEGYQNAVACKLDAIEQLMTLLQEQASFGPTLLCGRAAEGHLDGVSPHHLRVTTRASDGEIARALVAAGYNEPEFQSVHGPYGTFSQVRVMEDNMDFVITRVPPAVRLPPDRNLRTGDPIRLASLAEVRLLIQQRSGRPSRATRSGRKSHLP